ncbi:hypothetical protein GQ53DRAFT_888320 [Thozetella sp. PMI_491]|nr:hypothetical protein GQ53DRAFT_888320 [Thozetella sp. PMI_491]
MVMSTLATSSGSLAARPSLRSTFNDFIKPKDPIKKVDDKTSSSGKASEVLKQFARQEPKGTNRPVSTENRPTSVLVEQKALQTPSNRQNSWNFASKTQDSRSTDSPQQKRSSGFDHGRFSSGVQKHVIKHRWMANAKHGIRVLEKRLRQRRQTYHVNSRLALQGIARIQSLQATSHQEADDGVGYRLRDSDHRLHRDEYRPGMIFSTAYHTACTTEEPSEDLLDNLTVTSRGTVCTKYRMFVVLRAADDGVTCKTLPIFTHQGAGIKYKRAKREFVSIRDVNDKCCEEAEGFYDAVLCERPEKLRTPRRVLCVAGKSCINMSQPYQHRFDSYATIEGYMLPREFRHLVSIFADFTIGQVYKLEEEVDKMDEADGDGRD